MSDFRSKPSVTLSQPAVIVALTLAFLLTVAACVLAAVSTRRVTEADLQAKRAQHTLEHAASLLAALNESGTAVRRHLLTGAPDQLEVFEMSRQRVSSALQELRREFVGREEEGIIFPPLQEMIDGQFTNLERALVLSQDKGLVAGLTLLETDQSRQLHDNIRQSIAALQRVELMTLAQGSAVAAERAELIQALNVGLITLAVTLAATAAWFLLRRVRELEGFTTVCAWTRRVQWKGRWISFEEYLAERFHQRCTHGICEEAAEKLRTEATVDPKPIRALPRPLTAQPFRTPSS